MKALHYPRFDFLEINEFPVPVPGNHEVLLGVAACGLCGSELETFHNGSPRRDADALLVQWAPINEEVIAGLKQCKVIVRYGIGYDNVDLKAAAKRGIPVCNVPDYCIDEVADHSLALALALARQVPQIDSSVRAGTWKIIPPSPFPSFRETVFATAGFGRIARAVLDRAKPFGFQLAAYDPFVDSSVFSAAGIRSLNKIELMRQAGILSPHLPLNSETNHFLEKNELASLRPQAVVINTARGGLIDSIALAEALSARKIAGAGLDVFETEPLPPDHPLRTAPNILLTSHTAWYSGRSIPVLQRKAAEEGVRGLRAEPLLNLVKKFPV
jgi:D-3-phosphoglycerate dehydrogenase / 2-oxoglutarate reductase